MSSVRLSLDLQDDRPVHDPVQERHRQRRIAQVLAPGLEIDVRHQRRRTTAADVDQLVQQARRLGRFQPFYSVEAELVEDHQVEFGVVPQPPRQRLVRQRRRQVLQDRGAGLVPHPITQHTGAWPIAWIRWLLPTPLCPTQTRF